MTGLVGALRVVLGVNSAQYESGMRRASQTARSTGSDISRALTSAQRTAVTAFRGIAAAAGVAGIAGAASVFARYVDAAKQLEAQLRLATRESGNFSQAQQDVRRIAQETRTGLEETANLYAVFQRNARELSITQEQAARATETVSKSFQISGASAAEAAGGLRQFLQGVQSGTLRGEELNSVLENAPRLARLLADSLGVTIGQLRAMGQAGELTADKLITALTDRRFTEQIDEEFRQLPVTFDQAMTQIKNAATVAFGAFDAGGEFSNALIDFAGTGEMSFSQIEQAAFETGRTIRGIMAGLADVFDPMGAGALNIFDMIRQEAHGVATAIADILHTAQDAFNLVQNIAGARFDFASMSMVYPEQATFADRYSQNLNANTNNAGIIGAWQEQMGGGRTEGAAPRPPRLSGGGGGGRRRTGGGGRSRVARPLTRTGDLMDVGVSPYLLGRTMDELESDVASMNDALGSTPELLSRIENNIPDLGNMLTIEDREEMEGFLYSFNRDLTDGLAGAIVYGEDLGDVLVNTIRRAAAELISSGLMQLLTGQGPTGGILGSLMSMFGGSTGINGGSFGANVSSGMSGASGFLAGFATGGSIVVGGRSGIDRNLLSLNGVPVARVSQGETIGVSPNGRGAVVEVILRDALLDARIVSGAGVVVRQQRPGIVREAAGETMRLAGRPRLGG